MRRTYINLRLLPSLIAGLVLAAVLSGCQTIAITGFTGAVAASADKQRSVGDAVNDNTIYAEINHYFLQTDVHGLLMDIHITVRKGRVLLTGRTAKRETAVKAEQQAWRADGVREVINEIEISPDGTLLDRANDELIEKELEFRLGTAAGTNVFNYSIEMSNGVAYLLGMVSTEEENRKILEVARTTKGVKRVVSHLRLPTQYPELPHK